MSFSVEKGVRQVFLDDAGVQESSGLRRVVHQPLKHPENPVFRGEREHDHRVMVSDVLRVPGTDLLRMYYSAIPAPGKEPWDVDGRAVDSAIFFACAESRDGVHWERPNLGQISFQGSRDNNLIDTCDAETDYFCRGGRVIIDPRETDPAKRYKCFLWAHRDPDVIHMLVSPDGLHWSPFEGNPLATASAFDTDMKPIWDEATGRYLAYGRYDLGRVTALSTSPDLVHWSEPKIVIKLGDPAQPYQYDDPIQIYHTEVYPFHGMYLGFLNTFYHEWKVNCGTLDIQLVSSRDGVEWHLADPAQPFIPRHPGAQHIRSPGAMIEQGDEVYFYYSASPYGHAGAPGLAMEESYSSWRIDLVTLKKDRFVSLAGGEAEGLVDRHRRDHRAEKEAHLVTKPFVLPGRELHVNTDSSRGHLHASILDDSGNPVPGFEKSDVISDDYLDAKVRWPDKELSELTGRKVQLRFSLMCAHLFVYWVD